MAVEDFTTYTEVDPNSKVAPLSTEIQVRALQKNQIAYVYDDKGVDHFDGDFEHLITIVPISGDTGNALSLTWVLSNYVGTQQDHADTSQSYLYVQHNNNHSTNERRIVLGEVDSGSATAESYVFVPLDTKYLKIVRDEAVGTYGTLYCYIYSDAERTTLITTLSVTLNSSKKDFRYLYGVMSREHATETFDIDFDVENLDIQEAAPPTPVRVSRALGRSIAGGMTRELRY